MKTVRNLNCSPRFILVLIVSSLSFAGLGMALVPHHGQDDLSKKAAELAARLDLDKMKVHNSTSAFVLVRRVKEGGLVRLFLRNDYSQDITAYICSFGNEEDMEEMISAMHDDSIKPGEIREVLFGIGNDPELESRGIGVLAVALEDGTADGDVGAVSQIRDLRRGESLELGRIAGILGESPANPSVVTQAELSRLQAAVSDGGAATKEDLPSYVREGINAARDRVSRMVQQLQQKGDSADITTGFAQMRQYVRTRRSRFEQRIHLIGTTSQ